jgi:hypothetical protein
MTSSVEVLAAMVEGGDGQGQGHRNGDSEHQLDVRADRRQGSADPRPPRSGILRVRVLPGHADEVASLELAVRRLEAFAQRDANDELAETMLMDLALVPGEAADAQAGLTVRAELASPGF